MISDQANEIISQKALIVKDNRFLILFRTRNEHAFPGLWDFAGGKLDLGEDELEGLKREIKEETGFEIKPKEVLGVYYTKSYSGNQTVKFIIYDADVISGELKISDEHEKYQWATVEEIAKLPVMPFMANFLADFKLKIK